MLVFVEGRTNRTNLTHIWCQARITPRPHWWEASVLTSPSSLLPICLSFCDSSNRQCTVHVHVYNYFKKGCLTNGEKLMRQCRKLLWVMGVFTIALVNPGCFSMMEGNNRHIYSFSLLPCCWITLNLNQSKPNPYYPSYQLTLSRTLLNFCGTTFVETAVYTVQLQVILSRIPLSLP